jgi:cytochrome P450
VTTTVDRDSSAMSLPPGPPPRDGIVASARYFAGFFFDPIGFVSQRFATYGDIYYAPSGGTGLYVLRHPDHLREVLVTRAASFHKKHTAFERLGLVLGEGLLTTDGETWKRQRRMVQPAFAHARLAGYARVMTEEAARAAGGWRDGEVLDVGREMMQLTLRVVSRTLFGHDVPAGQIETVGRAMTLFQRSILRPQLLPQFLPSPGRRRLARSLEALDRMIYDIIGARRTSGGAPASDLLQMLVDAVDEEGDGGRLTERELRDQLVTLFLAGHETTSHALTWTLYLLSQNPDAERTLHEELDRVLGERDPAYDDLDRLPYTRQVIEESMRLYPPVYSMARKAHEDTEIGGYRVPAGSEVILWIYLTHRDPRFYPEPDAFRPERFAPVEEASRPKLAYLPFGAGPRACIGKVFAMLEARLLLATVARRWRLEFGGRGRVTGEPRITLVPKGAKMRVRRRVSATSEAARGSLRA